MGFLKKLGRETRRIARQARHIPIIGPAIVPALAIVIPGVGPALAVAAALEDPRNILPAVVGVIAPELTPLTAVVDNPKAAVPLLVGAIAPELTPLTAVVDNPKAAVPLIVGAIAPDLASVASDIGLLRIHVPSVNEGGDIYSNEPLKQRESLVHRPFPQPKAAPDLNTNPILVRPNGLETFSDVNPTSDLRTCIKTEKCTQAQQRADALCGESGNSDAGKWAGGDLITQGIVCRAAIDAAKKACE